MASFIDELPVPVGLLVARAGHVGLSGHMVVLTEPVVNPSQNRAFMKSVTTQTSSQASMISKVIFRVYIQI